MLSFSKVLRAIVGLYRTRALRKKVHIFVA